MPSPAGLLHVRRVETAAVCNYIISLLNKRECALENLCALCVKISANPGPTEIATEFSTRRTQRFSRGQGAAEVADLATLKEDIKRLINTKVH
jgi:hypothetical protein